MHQAGAKNLITMAPVSALYDDGSGTGRSAVDIWVLLPIMHDNSRTQVADVLKKGDSVWSYNTLVQDSYSPKWLIDFDSIDFRIQPGFINQSLNLTGLLYWRVDLWSSDPWNNVNNAGTFGSGNYPGDGMLVYPGQQVGIQGVAPSVRLKWLRDGIDDYEYVSILKKLGRGDWALQLARSVGADWYNWTRDRAKLESVRRQLGDEIHRLSSPSVPSSPSNPSPANGATGVGLTPVLSWSAAASATSYDVHFGTSTSPPLVTTTTDTSHSPGSLAHGTTYYWMVVARNSSGSASSPVWSFTTEKAPAAANMAPTAVSVNPSSGRGASQTFQLAYSDENGASDLAGAGALINGTLSGSGACWFYYETSGNRIWLANNDASDWSSTTLGSSTTLQNSQCTLSAGSSSVSTSGNNLTLSVALSFPTTFAGTKTVYLVANDKGGLSSGYQALGTWTVPEANVAPTAVSVDPSSGSGLSQTFQFAYSDANGASDVAGAGALINSTLSGSNACWIYYDASDKRIWLASDNGSSWSSALLGSSTTLQNSQCAVSANSAKVATSGSSLTLGVSLSFKSTFAGTKTVHLYAHDKAGLSSGYKALGTWTVPSLISSR